MFLKYFAARYRVVFGCVHVFVFIFIPGLKTDLIWKSPHWSVSWRKCMLFRIGKEFTYV